jgi:hypothetical protein
MHLKKYVCSKLKYVLYACLNMSESNFALSPFCIDGISYLFTVYLNRKLGI